MRPVQSCLSSDGSSRRRQIEVKTRVRAGQSSEREPSEYTSRGDILCMSSNPSELREAVSGLPRKKSGEKVLYLLVSRPAYADLGECLPRGRSWWWPDPSGQAQERIGVQESAGADNIGRVGWLEHT